MTRLLVSVRGAAEAEIACAAGVDLVDLKEPLRGALAPVAPSVLEQAIAVVAGRRPLSAALGELVEIDPARVAALPPTLRYAKLGLAGVRGLSDWPARWAAALDHLPLSVERVAVVYADHEAASAPVPHAILEHAAGAGCRVVLVDTYTKRHGRLTELWSTTELLDFARAVRERGLGLALAGSLVLEDLPTVLAARPDWVAVRGAVCVGSRTGALVGEKILAWRAALQPRSVAG
jgi:(5-formylfuran-3-yl)methyl phosphate synthase